MFSFLVAQTSVVLFGKKVNRHRVSHICSCAFEKQNQAYRFSHRYYLSNFLSIQKQSFQAFLQQGLIHELNQQNIYAHFQWDKRDTKLKLTFYPEAYRLVEPKLTVKQAIYRRKTYSSDLYVPIKIENEKTKSFILNWFCLATIPLMTPNGHFIVNGLPRMIMSQIVRSPGIYFKRIFRSENLQSDYYVADFIAQRGTWLRFETDLKQGEIWVKMKNEQKMAFMHFFQFVGLAFPLFTQSYNPVLNTRFEPEEKEKGLNGVLKRAYRNEQGSKEKGYDTLLADAIARLFVRTVIKKKGKKVIKKTIYDPLSWIKKRLKEVMLLPGQTGNQKRAERFFQTFSAEPSISSLPKQPLDLIPLMTNTLEWSTQKRYKLEQKYDFDEESSPLFGMSETHVEDLFEQLDLEYQLNYNNIFLEHFPDFGVKEMRFFVNTIIKPKLFNKRTYNLSLVGRAKLNQTLGLSIPLNYSLLTPYDLLFGALHLVQCATGKKPLSDIDHLMNRKIKPVGELMQNQFAIGLQRFEDAFVEHLDSIGEKKKKSFYFLWEAFSQQVSSKDLETKLIEYFKMSIDAKPINTAFKEFFNSNPLSQMLDQTNPLAEITHKRRLSSLGIGGVSRQNAGFDIRGIHPTHYGRICPIETPEGQNAGLVNSFTIYSRVNSLGFIQTPFYKLYRGFVIREKGPVFFLANQEKNYRIAPGDLSSNSFGFLPQGILLPSRKTKLFERVDRSDLEYIGVNPLQMISIATSLIPFVEHNDGNRALMGSNMQRQSVPTLHPTPPIVGTGLETKVLLDIDHVLQAKQSGFVSYVDSQKICLYCPDLSKTSNQTFLVTQGDKTELETKKIKTTEMSSSSRMKQALMQKRKYSFESQSSVSFAREKARAVFKNRLKSNFSKKQPTFNSLCIKNNKPFLSFLSLTQFQKLYQGQLQNDRFGLMQILEIMKKQKTYDPKQYKVNRFNNPFLLALKHRATLDSSQIFLNAAFFALQSFSESICFSFNPCVSNPLGEQPPQSKTNGEKQNVFFLPSQEQKSPFAKRIRLKFKKKKMIRAFSPRLLPLMVGTTTEAQKQEADQSQGEKTITFSFAHRAKAREAKLKTLRLLQNELSCFFDPTQTTFKKPFTPSFFLRTQSSLEAAFLPQNKTLFSPLVPKTLFNMITVHKFQKRIQGQWRKKNTTVKPVFCQSGLIKNSSFSYGGDNYRSAKAKEAERQAFSKAPIFSSNPIQQTKTDFKFVNSKQIVLQKQLFYQNLPVWFRPTPVQPNTMGYLPLDQIIEQEKTVPQLSPVLKINPTDPFQKTRLQQTVYPLDKISRSNQDTYLLHRPVVQPGQWVEKGDVLADNSSSYQGDLAIGKNLLVGYTPWEGYNFEDAVLLSDRVVSQELFSSLHVERYEVEVRDTPEGIEQIQADVPSLSDISHLDKNGIVKVGTWVTTGDILVGKQTPRAPVPDKNAFEGLVHAIFAERTPADTHRDTSLRVPPDVHGWVVHVEVVETIDDFEYLKAVKVARKKIQQQIALDKKAQKKAQKKEQKKETAPKHKKTQKKETTAKRKKESKKESKKEFKTEDTKQSSQKHKKPTSKNSRNPFVKQSNLNCLQKKRPHLAHLYRSTRHGFNFAFFDNNDQQSFKPEIFDNSSTELPYQTVFNSPRYSTVSFRDLWDNFSFNMTPKIEKQVRDRLKAFHSDKRLTENEPQKRNRVISKETVDFFADDLDNKHIKGMFGVSKQDLYFKKITPPQVPRRVNVYIAEKRSIQVGDKIAGRHGNKGIISNILPRQDMPYLPDGTPLDLVLNPLGVPSRMNVGQIFECLLGLAGSYLHQTYKIQPFDEQHGCEASRSLVYSKLYEARIKTKQNWLFDPNFPGKVRLFDGRTGQCFEQPVTVGKAYILKLIHLVDEKIHARSTGPYSVVTQQPLRGRSNKGGQRVGEMEVWALEGFGAAYILQELLTVKSDDLLGGRESLIKTLVEDRDLIFGPPESFRVLLRELEALCVGAYVE